MKRIPAVLIAIVSFVIVNAQSPENLSYQAVIWNSNNELLRNTSIGMQISILQGVDAATATEVYIERQFPTSNSNGLVTIEIGGTAATVVSGSFPDIDWSDGNHFIKTETDINGGSNYSISGINQLLSVPYALYAKEVENKDDADSDPTNEIQELSKTPTNFPNAALTGAWKPLLIPAKIARKIRPNFSIILPSVVEWVGR